METMRKLSQTTSKVLRSIFAAGMPKSCAAAEFGSATKSAKLHRTNDRRHLSLPTLPVSPMELATALGLVVIGSIIQGSIGFGLAAVVAPILLLVNKIFLPGPMLVTSMLLTSLIAWRDREHAVWPEVAVGTTGRIIGMMPAALALRFLSGPGYELLFAIAVLAGVVISMAGWHIRLTLRNLFFTAIGSGFVSTVSAVGGPPMALVFPKEQGH